MNSLDVLKFENAIRKGSKSFAVASLFFSKEEKISAWKLYSWCRYCDDEIDEATDSVEARKRLNILITETNQLGMNHSFDKFQMQGMSEVMQTYLIPKKYPLDLLIGMQMDVTGIRFRTLNDLEEYCYCVAGTVGLMMCHILGIKSDDALTHAVSLGGAMQLTNICRDIHEDHLKGRFYLPLTLLEDSGITENGIFESQHQGVLIEIQEKLLMRADELYQEGYQGLKYLSLRSSWAVLIAAKMYSHIGS